MERAHAGIFDQSLKGILNKLTPQTYKKVEAQLFELPVDTAPLLKFIVQHIFDKVVDNETASAELYAKLCADLHKQASNVWPYVKVVVDAGTTDGLAGGLWWCADMSSSAPAELLGPCADEADALDLVAKVASGSQEGTQLMTSPPDATLVKLLKYGDLLVKLWTSSVAAPGQILVSFDAFEDTVEAAAAVGMADGPFFDTIKEGGKVVAGYDEAMRWGELANSVKMLLLNMCQEAFEAEKRILRNMQFVGELYKLPRFMKEDVIHSCVQKLLGVTNYTDDDSLAMDAKGHPVLIETQKISKADEANIEALAKLLQNVGAKFEADCAKDQFKSALMELYFDRLQVIATDSSLPYRMRFMVQDFFELRNNDYVPRRKEDKEMTQEQIWGIAAEAMGDGAAGGGGGGGGGTRGGMNRQKGRGGCKEQQGSWERGKGMD